MRFSTLVLALIPTAFAVPVPAPGLLDSVGKFLEDLPIVGAVTDAIKRPELLVARLQVVKGLAQTRGALQSIIDETAGEDNAAVANTAQTALNGVEKAQGAVNSIGKAILSSDTPERSDQETVAQGLVEAQGAISQLSSQVVTPSDALTKDIDDATDGIALAIKGGEGVLAASGLTPEDVGLIVPPKNGNAPPPPASSSAPPASSSVDVEAPVDTAVNNNTAIIQPPPTRA